MGGIDRMIASTLSSEIKKQLNLDVLKKTERELFLEHGMSIKLSIEHFHKFSSVLRKNSTLDIKKFEKDCINKILKESNVPKTSGYRKIENLILNGLIIESGKVLSESKKISKLQCVFQEMKLDIKKEKITIIGTITRKMFEKSTSMKSIIETFE